MASGNNRDWLSISLAAIGVLVSIAVSYSAREQDNGARNERLAALEKRVSDLASASDRNRDRIGNAEGDYKAATERLKRIEKDVDTIINMVRSGGRNGGGH